MLDATSIVVGLLGFVAAAVSGTILVRANPADPIPVWRAPEHNPPSSRLWGAAALVCALFGALQVGSLGAAVLFALFCYLPLFVLVSAHNRKARRGEA